MIAITWWQFCLALSGAGILGYFACALMVIAREPDDEGANHTVTAADKTAGT